MIEASIIARILATTALAFGITGSSAVATPTAPTAPQSSRCPFAAPGPVDADVIRTVPAAHSRTIWI